MVNARAWDPFSPHIPAAPDDVEPEEQAPAEVPEIVAETAGDEPEQAPASEDLDEELAAALRDLDRLREATE